MRISEYMALLDACLELPEPQRGGALAEIDGHLREAATAEGAVDDDPVAPALSALGSPRSAAARLTLAHRPTPSGQILPRRAWRALNRAMGQSGSRRYLANQFAFGLYIQTAFLSGLLSHWSVLDLVRPAPQWAMTVVQVGAQVLVAVLVYRALLAALVRLTVSEVRALAIGLCGLLIAVPISLAALKISGVWGPARELAWVSIVVCLNYGVSCAIGVRSVWRVGVVRETMPPSLPPKRYTLVFVAELAAFVALLFVPGLVLHLRPVPLAVVHGLGSAALVICAAAMMWLASPRFIYPLTTFLSTVPVLAVGVALYCVFSGDVGGGVASLVIGIVAWRPVQWLGRKASLRADAAAASASPST